MTQGKLESLSKVMEQAASSLEMSIMKDIVRRIKANSGMTSSAEYQIDRLRQMGETDRHIKKQIQTYLRISDQEIDRIYNQVVENEYDKFSSIYEKTGRKHIPFGEHQAMKAVVASVLQQSRSTFKNITQSLGFVTIKSGEHVFTPLSDYYQNVLDEAMLEIFSGAFSYDVALKKAIGKMTNSGLRTVEYASGRSYRIESASRTALMTGFGQITGYMNEQVAAELGTNDYETSYHIGARPEHQVWQGKVFSHEELRLICGLGTVTGLCGANCYHWYEPFIRGVSARNYTDDELERMIRSENIPRSYNGKEYTIYTALQKQRSMERTMRKQRQDIALLKEGEADDLSIVAEKSRYRNTMQQYVDFSNAIGLPQQKDRIYMDGLSRLV